MFIRVIVIILLLCGNLFAADVSVGPTASGNGTGSDWNNIAQWSSLTFTRGDTYYLQDGTYSGAKTLDTAVSGSTYIYIKKATESAHGSSTGWSSTYGDGVATFTHTSDILNVNTSYWDISGVTGGGPGSWTSGHGIVFDSTVGNNVTYIILASGVSFINVRHASFIQTGNPETTGTGGTAIYNATTIDNCTFEYNYFNNLVGLPFLLRGGSGNIIQYNYSGDVCGAYEFDVGIHCEVLVQHSMNNFYFRYNYLLECPSTGGFVKNNSTTSDNVYIYGNVFTHTTGDAGGMSLAVNGTATNWRVFNNVFANGVTGFMSLSGTFGNSNLVYNNIFYNTAELSAIQGVHDYNWFSRITSMQYTMNPSANENMTDLPGTVTETLNPFVDNTGTTPEAFRLSAAITGWAGTNTCILDNCVGEKTFNIDAFGVTRGADGVWDRGAYEYTGADTTPPVRSAGSPSGTLAAGTTSTSMSLTTDENATCKYGTVASTAYADIASTFSTTGTTSHSQTLSGLTDGSTYTYYVRCIDGSSNANTNDYTITFGVANAAAAGAEGMQGVAFRGVWR